MEYYPFIPWVFNIFFLFIFFTFTVETVNAAMIFFFVCFSCAFEQFLTVLAQLQAADCEMSFVLSLATLII